MKSNYSHLLLALVSSISMASTLGLSAQPGLSVQSGSQCMTKFDDGIRGSTSTIYRLPIPKITLVILEDTTDGGCSYL